MLGLEGVDVIVVNDGWMAVHQMRPLGETDTAAAVLAACFRGLYAAAAAVVPP